MLHLETQWRRREAGSTSVDKGLSGDKAERWSVDGVDSPGSGVRQLTMATPEAEGPALGPDCLGSNPNPNTY